MEPDNKEPVQAPPSIDQFRSAPIGLSPAEQYVEDVKSGKIRPTKEDLKGFLPRQGIYNESYNISAETRVRDTAQKARVEAQRKIDAPYIAPSLRKNTPEEAATVEAAGLSAATERQATDLDHASAALVKTIQEDPMFFRGMTIHNRITAGEEPFEIGKDGMLTDKGKMDLADYRYYYDSPKRNITFMHGASSMIATLKFEISDTIEHLMDEPTAVINDHYKDKKNYDALTKEARDFVMMGVQLKISTSELVSGKIDVDRTIKVAELQGRRVDELIKQKEQYIALYRNFTDPPEVVIDGKKVKPEPMFKLPGAWASAGNKLNGVIESAGRVFRGWADLAFDASKDPLSWHGSLDDAAHRNAYMARAEIEQDPELKKSLLQVAGEKDGYTITARRLNRAGRDIAHMQKWASGDIMMFGGPYMSNGPGSQADPNVWTPGQTWVDPLMLYGLGSGAFRAIRASSAAEAALMSRYAAVSKVATLENFTVEVANATKQFSGIGGIMEKVGLAYLAELGEDITKLTAEQIQEIGMKRILNSPFQALNASMLADDVLNELMNAVPRPQALASVTDEQWQLLSGRQKLASLEPPASFAGVENGADLWSKMSVEQRANIVVGEKVSEIHRLARARQAQAIAEAATASKNAAEASAETNGNASVARRTGGKVTSIFGEWVLGGRELGNGFWRDLSIAGLANSTAGLIDDSIKWGFTRAAGEASGEMAEQWLRDQASARFVARTMVGLGAAAGINGIDAYMGSDSPWVKYPKYIVNTLGFIVGMRVIGANAQSMGKFMKVWGDEIARGDPTLWRGYAHKIAKNPEAYGFDPKEAFGPASVATFMSNFGIESILRFGKRSLYDFGIKGGGVAELVVYGKDRDAIGQGAAIGTVFSAVGYYGAMGAQWGFGNNKLNAMRSDALFRAMNTAGGDPTNILNFIDAHSKSVKGGYEKDLLGFFLGVDNSTRGRVRFIDDKTAAALRFAYDYGLKDQSEQIRRSINLGFKTPEDVIGGVLKQEQINKAVIEVTNRLNQETGLLTTEIAQNTDVVKQLVERAKNPALTREERVDIATQIRMVRDKINESKTKIGKLKQSLSGSDPITFLKENGYDIDTINANVRAGINETTGNPVMTFKGLTIETTKDGPIVYINKDKMTTQAMWHEAGEAVLLAGSVEHVVNDATNKMFGNVAKNPQVLENNKKLVAEALKNGEDINSPEFLNKLFGMDTFSSGSKPMLNHDVFNRMLDAHAESAGLDDAWKMSARAALREYLTTGNKFGVDNLTREIFANYLGLYLEESPKLRLYNHGDLLMTLEGFSDRAFGWMAQDTNLERVGRSQLTTNSNNVATPENIRSFFVDPTTGKRVQIKAFDRIAREAIRRSNKFGTTPEGKPTVDLRKMTPVERRSWVTANNVPHWLDESGNLRDAETIAQVESTMTHQSMVDLDQFRNDNPSFIRTKKDVKTGKNGTTTTIDGIFSPGEINALLQNPDLPENVRNTIVAYSKAVYRQDGKIGLMQGMYSGESKETVYTPNSTPSLREWGSPLLNPEHRALLPLSMSITWEKDANGLTSKAAVRVNGLDWKAVDKRVLIAAGSDLAVQHGFTVSDLYGFMNDYVVNLNKGNANQDPKQNAVPSAKLFDHNGSNPQRGENIRDLMHFIFDFQKKKNDAYLNQPPDWGDLSMRGPTHPFTTMRADRWTSAETSDNGVFIRVNEAAYKLSQGNFMGDEAPKRKLNRKDVSETTPEKEAEAQKKVIGELPDLPALRESGKFIDTSEPLPPNRDDVIGRLNDLYAYDGEVMPGLVRKWFEDTEANMAMGTPPKTTIEYVEAFANFVLSESKRGGKGRANAQDRAQYVLPMIEALRDKARKHMAGTEKAKAEVRAEQARLEMEAARAAGEADATARAKPIGLATEGDAARAVPMPVTAEVSQKLLLANEGIQMWKGNVDVADVPGEFQGLAESERPFYLREMKKHLDAAFSLKPDFDPGFDIYKYFPDYVKPELRADIQAKVDAEAANRRAVAEANKPKGQADAALVSELNAGADDALSSIRVIVNEADGKQPLEIKEYFLGQTKIGVGIDNLFKVMRGEKGTIDYVYNAQLATSYVAGLEALMKANEKKIAAAKSKNNDQEVSWRTKYQKQMSELQNRVAGLGEHAQSIADTAPARQKPTAETKPKVDLNDPKVVEWRKKNGIINNKDGQWIEPIPDDVIKIFDKKYTDLAQLIDSAVNYGGKASDFADLGRQVRILLKEAMDKGMTSKQFYATYDIGKGAGKKALLKEIESVVGTAFPKEGLYNVLVPESVTVKHFTKQAKPAAEAKPTAEAKPAEPAPTAEAKPDLNVKKVTKELKDLSDEYYRLESLEENTDNVSIRISDYIENLYKNGMSLLEIKKIVNKIDQDKGYQSQLKGILVDVEEQAKPAKPNKPNQKLESQAENILANDFFETHRMLRDDPQNWGGKKPNTDKKGFTEYARGIVRQLEEAGITPDIIIGLGYDVSQWTSVSKWDKEGIQILSDWVKKGKSSKPKAAAVEVPPELAPSIEPTTTGKPKWDSKKANKVASDIAEIIDRWEEEYADEGDTVSIDDDIFDQLDKLKEMGLNRSEIEKLINNDTSDGTISSALDDMFSDEKPASGGAKPPAPPKPTAQAAGSDQPAPKPKPTKPKEPDVVIPDAPLYRDHPTDFGDPNDPKKNVNNIKKTYGTKVRTEVDKKVLETVEEAKEAISDALTIKQYDKANTKNLEKAREKIKLALRAIQKLEGTTVNDLGIAMFDNSPNVRNRFLELYQEGFRDWFSKTQRTEIRNLTESLKSHDKRIDNLSARRVVDDFIGLYQATDITGSSPGQKGQSTIKVLSGKTPWTMAEDRTLLPITSRLNDFIVTERFIDPDTKTGAVGTSGLIFLDSTQKTSFNENAMYNVLNSIFDTNYFGFRKNGFFDLKVLNANGDLRNFRISTQGTRGLSPAELKKRYDEARKKQIAGKQPGERMPALEFDVNGNSYESTKDGVTLMNAEIAEFLRQGELDRIKSGEKDANRKAAEARRQQRKAEAEAKDKADQLKQEEAAKLAQIKLGLYGRQPIDPNDPTTAMNMVEGHRTIVSRRADNLIEIRKGKDKDADVFRVHYIGDTFGGPRMVLQTASIEAAQNLAQAYKPFEGYRTAFLSMFDDINISESGPWLDKDLKPTTDPKQVAPLSLITEKYHEQFADALTRIRSSGTYGVVDVGNGEFVIVPKKSIRDKDGNLDMSNPRIRLSRRLVVKAVMIAQEAETLKNQRQTANAQLPQPRTGQPAPAQGQPRPPQGQPQPAAGTPPAGVDLQAFTNERMNMILQSAKSDANTAKMETAAGVLKILTNADNMKIMYMRNGTIRVYGANNFLLVETNDEGEAFGWLLK